MSNYSDFSLVYDKLMNDVDYKKRTNYLLNLFNKNGKKPELLLDLACGTGGFSNQMALNGVEVIGIDMSEEMLSAARENSAELGTDVLFLCQKAEELDLYGTVDGAICCMDSINHITNIKNLKKAIEKVSLFLEKDSLFIFDVNTPYKHEKVLADNTFVIEEDNVYCVWQNEYHKESLTTDINLDFFIEEDGVYERYSEDFSERAYTVKELTEILEEYDFEVLHIYNDMSEENLDPTSERAIFVAKKVRETNGYY